MGLLLMADTGNKRSRDDAELELTGGEPEKGESDSIRLSGSDGLLHTCATFHRNPRSQLAMATSLSLLLHTSLQRSNCI